MTNNLSWTSLITAPEAESDSSSQSANSGSPVQVLLSQVQCLSLTMMNNFDITHAWRTYVTLINIVIYVITVNHHYYYFWYLCILLFGIDMNTNLLTTSNDLMIILLFYYFRLGMWLKVQCSLQCSLKQLTRV